MTISKADNYLLRKYVFPFEIRAFQRKLITCFEIWFDRSKIWRIRRISIMCFGKYDFVDQKYFLRKRLFGKPGSGDGGPSRQREASEASSRAQILVQHPKSSPLPTPPGPLLCCSWRIAQLKTIIKWGRSNFHKNMSGQFFTTPCLNN